MIKKVKLESLVECLDSKRIPLNENERTGRKGRIPYYGANGQVDSVNDYIFDEQLLLLAEDGGSWGSREKSSYIISGKSWVNNHAHVLRCKKEVNIYYLMQYLNHLDLRKYITGTTRGKLNQSRMNDIDILLLPLPVQRKIASILEKTESARKNRREASRLTNEFLKSAFLEMFGDPIKNPKGFSRRKIADFCETTSGGTPDRSNTEYYNGQIPWIKSGELNNSYVTNTEEMITELGLDNSSAKRLPIDAVLIAMYGATAGKVGLLKIEGATTNQAVAAVMADKKLSNPIYLFYYFWSILNVFLGKRVGGGQPNISQTIIRDTEVILPPLSMQKKFANLVQKVEKLKEKQQESEKELTNLFNSLMQQAFKGEIV